MRDPGSIWGLAVGLGTIILGLAFAYVLLRRAKSLADRDEARGVRPASDRWMRIGAAALVGLGVIIVSWWLFRVTPGVNG